MTEREFQNSVTAEIRQLMRPKRPAVVHLQVPRAYGAEAVCGNVLPDDELTMDRRATTCSICHLVIVSGDGA